MKYAGRIYDGPWEGRCIEHHSPYYEFNFVNYDSDRCIRNWSETPNFETFKRYLYRWSYALRAWVFVWPSR